MSTARFLLVASDVSPIQRAAAPILALRQPDIDGLVDELRRLYRGAGIQLAVNIGGLIVERLFGGDVERWKSRGRKDVSFRKLEKHPDLPFHASTLSRAVAIYMLSRRRGDLCMFERVSPSHLREIAPLPETEQDRFLERIESEGWSMRRLREEIAATLGRPNRFRRTPSARSQQLRRLLGSLRAEHLATNPRAIEHLGLEQSRELLELTRSALQQMEMLAKRLGARIQEFDRKTRVSDVAPRSDAAPQHSKRAAKK